MNEYAESSRLRGFGMGRERSNEIWNARARKFPQGKHRKCRKAVVREKPHRGIRRVFTFGPSPPPVFCCSWDFFCGKVSRISNLHATAATGHSVSDVRKATRANGVAVGEDQSITASQSGRGLRGQDVFCTNRLEKY
jgi:hypothetical protein